MIRKSMLAVVALLFLTACSSSSKVESASSSGGSCDRECLAGMITKYMDAMVAHKPDSLPVAPGMKFTEDCKEIKLGEGLWKTITGFTEYRRDIIDVRQGVAVSFLVAKEGSAEDLFVIRLKVADKKITEIESMVVRGQKEGMLYDLSHLKKISPMMAYVPKKNELSSREEMIKMAVTYPEGLKIGSFVKANSPMADNAYRYENGQTMAGPDCTFFPDCKKMKTQTIPRLAGIVYRVIAVDEEMGVVSIVMNFGPGSLFQGAGELYVFHSFKIFNKEMHVAEAYCEQVPPKTRAIWDAGL